ncbi:hypothetical protein ACRC59_004403 [Citrobacter youngae]
MDNEVDFSLSFYQELFCRTEETLRLCVKSMPPRENGNFTDGYLRGVIFHWWQMAKTYGISATAIEDEERYLRKLAGLPEEDEQR